MNEWFKKMTEQITALWGKWSLVQKLLLLGVLVVAVVIVVVLFSWSASPTMIPVLDTPITDTALRDRIVVRLNEENVHPVVSDTGLISVKDEQTARRMRTLLISEDLVPSNVEPWSIFDVERWTRTDFERKVDVRRAVIEEVRQHIKSLNDIDDVSVVVNLPEEKLFQADQNPVSASVVLFPRPGSDIVTNRKKIEGIQKLLLRAVEGLTVDNIIISDNNSNILNDFEGMAALDRLTLIQKQQKTIALLEAQYRARVLNALQQTYGTDRVRELNIKIDMDMSEKTSETTKYLPTELKPDNPETPYDDSKSVPSITKYSETESVTYEGTGIIPEGPGGVEGQTAPSYKDTNNLVGLHTKTIVKAEESISKSEISEVVSPAMGRRTVSVNIDGRWVKKKDDKGNYLVKDGMISREYIPISEEELQKVTQVVQDAVGYDATRKDSVSVLNIQFDRSKEFEKEDADFFAAQQRRLIIMWSLIGLGILLLLFLLYHLISREIKRRRRLREEELQRQHQLERERALWELEQQGKDTIPISVEEKRRLELEENARNLAREHPEDVALLIRTWLMEE